MGGMLTDGREHNPPSVTAADLSHCDREPIHVPGSIQPHGVLLVLDDELIVRRASQNVGPMLNLSPANVLDRPLTATLGPAVAEALHAAQTTLREQTRATWLQTLTVPVVGADRPMNALAHRTAGGIVLELEPADSASTSHMLAEDFAARIENVPTVAELSRITAESIRAATSFDRVLIYRFDEDANGTVVGEDGNGRLPALLDHRFPATDIPAQARELYRINRVRIIPDAGYQPVPLIGSSADSSGVPLDMSFAVLRSVSPVHVEYMRNMETASSMSVSILRNDRLWGLISCHHRDPKFVGYFTRGMCDLLARAFSLRLGALEHSEDYERRLQIRSSYAKLLARMADRGDFSAALMEQPDELLAFAAARGAAVLTEGKCLLVGQTPAEAEVRDLAEWLFHTVRREVYHTESLAVEYPPAAAFTGQASGLLAIAVSKIHPSYVLWFRPEVVRTVQWGGDPRKAAATNGDPARLHPRRSFETWRETVHQKAPPWKPGEIEDAAELRNAIVGIVLRNAEELAELNAELNRSNQELEAFSYSVSHDLRAPLRHIVGYAEVLRESGAGRLTPKEERCLATIIESSEYAGKLVEKLLGYSRLGRADLQLGRIDMNLLVREIRADVMRDAGTRRIVWNVAPLPDVMADLMMLRMAIRDLLANAVKYTRNRDEAVIEIGCHEDDRQFIFSIRDNGVGFDMQYADKLFGVFQRLHRWEDYEGTGIGLANVRRVIERHGGRTWAEAEEGRGATFFISLPKQPSQ
jgi:chemotaxis family two-component system sensor kinase Cph1